MSLSEVLAKKAMEYRMEDLQIRTLGNLNLSENEAEALTALLKHIEDENWDLGYDDAIMDTTHAKPLGG